MDKKIGLVLVALSLAGVASAQSSSPPLRAWSDSSVLPPFKEHVEKMGEERANWCIPTVDPVVGGQLFSTGGLDRKEILRRTIKQFEEALPTIPADQAAVRKQFEDQIKKLKDELAKLERASPGGNAPKPVQTPALAKALADLDKRLETRAGATAMRAFRASPEARNLARARATAASAVAAGKPEAGLAALLAAHRLEPKNPTHLVNAAGVANMLGWPVEALALLAAAEALKVEPQAILDIPGRAVLLNNRGHALLALGRWAEAETPLRKAASLAPLLAEANTNLSRSLLCQGKVEEATRVFRLGMRRTPPSSAAKDERLDEASASTPGEGLKPEDESQLRYPARIPFDLSKGKGWTMPTLKLPTTYAELKAYDSVAYPKIYSDYLARTQSQRSVELGRLKSERMQAGHRPSEATERRVKAIKHFAASAQYEGELYKLYAGMWEATRTAEEAIGRNQKALFTRLEAHDKRYQELLRQVPLPRCPPNSGDEVCRPERERYEREFAAVHLERRLKCQGIVMGVLADTRSLVKGSETMAAKFLDAAVRRKTAIAANLADPIEHEGVLLTIQSYAEAIFIRNAYGPTAKLARMLTIEANGHACDLPKSNPAKVGEAAEELDKAEAERCSPALSSGKLKLSLGVVELAANCESFQVELATKGLSPLFLSVERTTYGTTTLFFGIKGGKELGAGGAELKASFKEGIYLKWGADGLEDGGMRVSASLTAKLGKVGGEFYKAEFDFSVASAVAYWTEPQ